MNNQNYIGAGAEYSQGMSILANTGILISAPSKNKEDIKKEIHNIQVDVEGGEYIFLRTERVSMLSSHHQLGVVDQITGEDESSANSNSDHRPFCTR